MNDIVVLLNSFAELTLGEVFMSSIILAFITALINRVVEFD